MHTATGTFTAQTAASPKAIKLTEREGVETKPRRDGTAVLRGVGVGAAIGMAVFGFLLWLAGADATELRYMTLYLCGIAMCSAGAAAIVALWRLDARRSQ